MLLEELHQGDDAVSLINLALSELPAYADEKGKPPKIKFVSGARDEATEEAFRLFKLSQTRNMEEAYIGLQALPGARSMVGISSCLRALETAGFSDHPKMKMLYLAIKDKDKEDFKLARNDAIGFAMDVRSVFMALVKLALNALDPEMPGLAHGANDYTVAICKATLIKLGIPLKFPRVL
jgi:hypothetical protein